CARDGRGSGTDVW
nr:immunoglobulin heavy chain junction region [Macaca mulatta]MOX60947.1 immunoglobulin heavy chain junction region [Macaca mulatta]MOX62477.1 immunoglobulin heavy chain junction region [Macaca mulatta]MOX64489.1 immunoglobulin heavy chain junction region [Macaca mulatta]MOX68309.1 immunoglobulin heavy chain junction region [Macaca mulatta]